MRTTIARVLCGLVALLFIYNGVLYMFAPAGQLASTMIEPTGDGIFGMANIRANMGAPMVTFGILFAMGGALAEKIPLRVTMIFLVLAIIARIVGLISAGVDGENSSIRVMVALVVFLAVAAFGHQTFGDRHAAD